MAKKKVKSPITKWQRTLKETSKFLSSEGIAPRRGQFNKIAKKIYATVKEDNVPASRIKEVALHSYLEGKFTRAVKQVPVDVSAKERSLYSKVRRLNKEIKALNLRKKGNKGKRSKLLKKVGELNRERFRLDKKLGKKTPQKKQKQHRSQSKSEGETVLKGSDRVWEYMKTLNAYVSAKKFKEYQFMNSMTVYSDKSLPSSIINQYDKDIIDMQVATDSKLHTNWEEHYASTKRKGKKVTYGKLLRIEIVYTG